MNRLLLMGGAVLAAIFLTKRAKATGPGDIFDTTPAPGSENAPDVSPAPDELADALTDGLGQVLTTYGRETARRVEQMFRLETANFTSGGFRKTNAMGQKAFPRNGVYAFPWGWPARGTTADDYLPPVPLVDNGEQAVFKFVVYKRVQTAMKYLARYITDHGGRFEEWNSNDPATRSNYKAHVLQMGSPIVNSL